MKKNVDYYKIGLRKNLDKKYDEAMTAYTKAVELDPEHVDAYMQRGILGYRIFKKYTDALRDFDKAAQTAPERADTYLHRGIVKCHLLQFEEGLRDFNKAAQLTPNDERIYYNRGKVKYVLKFDKDDVCDDLNRALDLGLGQASDLITLFYGKDQDTVSRQVDKKIKKVNK